MKKVTCVDDRYSNGNEYEVEVVDLDREVAGMEPTFRAWASEAAENAAQVGEEFDAEEYLASCREEYRAGLRIYDETTGEWIEA